MESDDDGDGYGEPDTMTAKAKPCTPYPCKTRKVNRRSVRIEPTRMKLDRSSSDDDGGAQHCTPAEARTTQG